MSDVKLPIDEDRVLGLIPARGGSKSIPLKNIADLAGRPMIAYVIAAGVASRRLDRIICSTDHPSIAEACTARNVEVQPRPRQLAEDDTPVTAVILDVLRRLAIDDGVAPGMVALLQPTSPFLRAADIDACVEALCSRPDADSAQTVTPVLHNAHAFNQRVIEDGLVRFRFLEERRAAYNKQLKPKHYVFGNMVVTRSKALLAGKDCFGDRSVPVEIPRAYALDIDTSEDLDFSGYLAMQGRLQIGPP